MLKDEKIAFSEDMFNSEREDISTTTPKGAIKIKSGIKVKKTFIEWKYVREAMDIMKFIIDTHPEITDFGRKEKKAVEIRFIVRKTTKKYEGTQSLKSFNIYIADKETTLKLAKELRSNYNKGFRWCTYYSAFNFDYWARREKEEKEKKERLGSDAKLNFSEIAKLSNITNEFACKTKIVVLDFDDYNEKEFKDLDKLFSKVQLKPTIVRTSEFGKQYILKLNKYTDEKDLTAYIVDAFVESGIRIDSSKKAPASVFRIAETNNNKALEKGSKRTSVFRTYIEKYSDTEYSIDEIKAKSDKIKEAAYGMKIAKAEASVKKKEYTIELVGDDLPNEELIQSIDSDYEETMPIEVFEEMEEFIQVSFDEELKCTLDHAKVNSSTKQAEEILSHSIDFDEISKHYFRVVRDWDYKDEFELIKMMLAGAKTGIRDLTIRFLVPHFVNLRKLSLEDIQKIMVVFGSLCPEKMPKKEVEEKVKRFYDITVMQPEAYKHGVYTTELQEVFGPLKAYKISFGIEHEIMIGEIFIKEMKMMKGSATKMYVRLLAFESKQNKVYYSMDDLEAICGITDTQIRRNLKFLKGYVGSVYVTEEIDGKKIRSSRYYVKHTKRNEKTVPMDIDKAIMVTSSVENLTDAEMKLYLYLYFKLCWNYKYNKVDGLKEPRIVIKSEIGTKSIDYISKISNSLAKKGRIRKELHEIKDKNGFIKETYVEYFLK